MCHERRNSNCPTMGFAGKNYAKGLLAAQRNLISDYGSVFVGLGLNIKDFETAILQVGKIFLQGAMELVLQLRHLFGWGQDAGINTVGALRTGSRKQFDLLSLRRKRRFRLIAQPRSGHEEDKDQDADDGDVVLPGAAFEGPEEDARKNLSAVGHVSP